MLLYCLSWFSAIHGWNLAYTLGLGRPALFSIAWIHRCSVRPDNGGTVWFFLSYPLSNGEMMKYLEDRRSGGNSPTSRELCLDIYIYTNAGHNRKKNLGAAKFPQKLERYTSSLELLLSPREFSKIPPPLHQTQPPSTAENPQLPRPNTSPSTPTPILPA